MNRTYSIGTGGRRGNPVMQLELMNDGEGLLLSFRDKRQLDLKRELSPPGLGHLEGSFVDIYTTDVITATHKEIQTPSAKGAQDSRQPRNEGSGRSKGRERGRNERLLGLGKLSCSLKVTLLRKYPRSSAPPGRSSSSAEREA
jgi:hypothetical protein